MKTKSYKAYRNIFKLRRNMTKGISTLSNYPIMAFAEPTMFCNLKCRACPTGMHFKLRPAVSFNWERYTAFIDEIGDYLFKLCIYNWGEPLLNQDTPEMIKYARERGVEVVLSTNFSIKLSDDYIERLVKSGLDAMTVSLDGTTQETYEKYRRGGNLSVVRKNLKRIQEIKKNLGMRTPIIAWQFLVFQHNEHEIEFVKTNYKEWGADTLVVGAGKLPRTSNDDDIKSSTLREFNINKQLNRKISAINEKLCTWLYGAVVLQPNGKVSPCCATADEQDDFGEYHPGSGFFTVYNNDNYKKARDMFVKSKSKGTVKTSIMPSENILTTFNTGTELRKTLQPGELICHRCPSPNLWGDTSRLVGRIFIRTALDIFRKGKILNIVALIAMGGPNTAVFEIVRERCGRLFRKCRVLAEKL